MIRRIVGLAIGLVYAITVGFILMGLTGGGHGNFGPLIFFVLTSMFGLFYPTMGFIVADLRSLLAKSAFIAIFLIHFFLVFIFFTQGIIEANSSPRDFTFNEHPIFYSVVTFLLSAPQAGMLGMFVVHLLKGRDTDLE